MNEGRSPWTRFEKPLVLDPGDLDRLVARFLPGARVVRATFIDRGVVNSNYLLEMVPGPGPGLAPGAGGTPGAAVPDRVLLRLSRSDEGPLREGAVGALLGGLPGCLVPRLLGSERGERPEPHRRSLFSWIGGLPLDVAAPGGDPPGGALDAAAESLGRVLAALRARVFPAFGRLTPGLTVAAPASASWSEELARRVEARLANPAHGLADARREVVRAEFARLMARASAAPPAGAALVHGDLSPGNILLEEAAGGNTAGRAAHPAGEAGAAEAPARFRGPRLCGLVDWEMARAADPAHDLASLRFELGGRWPAFTRLVERSYLAAAADSAADHASPAAAGLPEGLELRVALSSIPILLDARMVAHRRRDRAALDRVDALLAAAPAGAAG